MPQVHQHVYVEWRGGTCRVKWWTGELHDNGRKRYESKGGFTDEEAAFQHGMDKLYEIRHGTHVSNRDGATPMTDWLDDWLASLDLAHLSIRNYSWAINSHIRPFFQRKTVGELDIMEHRAFKKYLVKANLGEHSIRNILMVFSMVMDDAVAAGLRKASPVERERRRGKYKKKARERKKDMPPEVVEHLARNAEIRWGFTGYAFIWTMAMTGMRPAELYGLTREYCYPNWPASDPRPDPAEEDRYDEDLQRYGKSDGLLPAIRVERQVQYEGGKLGFYAPKYDSYRSLVVPQFLADMLEALLESHGNEFVFPSIEGSCLGRIAFNREYWRPIADGMAEVPEVPSFKGKRMYLIRHGHKAWLDEDAHARFAVESRMGHEVQGVEGTYSSLTVPMERAVVKTLQERWELLGADWRTAASSSVARPPSIAALVRDALERGIDHPGAVVADVQLRRPEAKPATILRSIGRQRAREADRFPIGFPVEGT